MSKNFGALKDEIANWLAVNPNTAGVRLPDAVRGSIINIKRRELQRVYDLRFCEASFAIPYIANQMPPGSVALPNNFTRLITLRFFSGIHSHDEVYTNTAKLDIEFLPPDEIDLRVPAETGHLVSNNVLYATIWKGRIEYRPYPNPFMYPGPPGLSLVAAGRYLKLLPDLNENTDSDDLLVHAWDVLLWGSLADGSLYGVEDARVQAFQAKYEQALSRFVAEHAIAQLAQRTAFGRVISRESA